MQDTAVQRGVERRRFAQSSVVDKAMMLSMMAGQAVCQQALRHTPVHRLRSMGDAASGWYRRLPLPVPDAARTIARAEIVKSLQIWRAECVAESLVLWTLLRAGDHPAQLRVGCRNLLGEIEAHMWVELNGKALLDLEGERATWEAFDAPFG